MEVIRSKYNLMVDLLKFIFNENKILSKVVALLYNQVCCQTWSKEFYIGLKKYRVVTNLF